MHMFAVLSRLAWRNLWRNHCRTLIMLLAIVLGTWAMIFMTALMRGMVSQMVSDGISALPGHVQVHHPDYRDDPSIANLINVPDAEIVERFGGAGFRQWASRVRVFRLAPWTHLCGNISPSYPRKNRWHPDCKERPAVASHLLHSCRRYFFSVHGWLSLVP